MAASEPKPLPPRRGKNPQIQKFRKQAEAILAEHRGINPESEIRLRALGEELGLSELELKQAIEALDGSRAAGPKLSLQQRKQHDRFRKGVCKALSKAPQEILPAAQRDKWVQQAQHKFTLPEQLARETIDQLAAERGIQFVSRANATEYITRRIEGMMDDSSLIDAKAVKRIYEEGRKWGLTNADVKAILANQARMKVGYNWFSSVALALTSLVVIGVIGLVCLLLWVSIKPDKEVTGAAAADSSDAGDDTTSQNGSRGREQPLVSKEWWDVDLIVVMGRAPRIMPDFMPVLEPIAFTDPARRGNAYEDLMKLDLTALCAGGAEDQQKLSDLREIIAGCYALDPSDESAGRLREALLALVPSSGSTLPKDPAVHRRSYWAVQTAVVALGRKGLNPDRAESLAQTVARTLSVSVDRNLAPKELQRQCLAALSVHLCRVHIASAASQPDSVRESYDAVMVIAKRYIDRKRREQLDMGLLLAALPAAGEAWSNYKDLTERCVASADALNVLKLVDLFEKTSNSGLQDYLAKLLLERVGAPPESTSAAQVARTVREALGAAGGPGGSTPEDRWKTLSEQANRALAGPAASVDRPEKLLPEIVNLAYFSTLGCALVQKDYATFDQLQSTGPPKLITAPSGGRFTPGARPVPGGRTVPGMRPAPGIRGMPGAPPVPGPRGPGPGFIGPGGVIMTPPTQSITSIFAVLGNRRAGEVTRAFAFSNLAGYAHYVPKLTADQGAVVARYLLEPRKKGIAPIKAYIKPVARWRSVRLGLADELLGTPNRATEAYREYVLTLVAEALGRSREAPKKQSWQETRMMLRRLLLRDVLATLPLAGAGSGDPEKLYDQTSQALGELYGTQAKTLGLPAQDYADSTAPAQVLLPMVNYQTENTKSRALRPKDREYLELLPHEVAVTEYLGTNDLARTVLLQRVWLRLLAVGVVQENPGRDAQVEELVEQLRRFDRGATHVLAQLREGEATILRIWLAFGETN